TLTRDLARASGLLDRPGVEVIGTDDATEEQLTAVRDAPYIEAVRRASGPDVPAVPDGLISFGIGGDDVPPFPGMHAASARIAGASVTAIDAVRSGRSTRAVNIAGGLHHARPGAASGFCVYSDAAIAIRHALDAGEERVMYVDVDVNHGDCVELPLWVEPVAATPPGHRPGERLLPRTGFGLESGGPAAPGSAISVPLAAGTDAAGWVRSTRATVPALVRAVRPTLLVTQQGADIHRLDT